MDPDSLAIREFFHRLSLEQEKPRMVTIDVEHNHLSSFFL